MKLGISSLLLLLAIISAYLHLTVLLFRMSLSKLFLDVKSCFLVVKPGKKNLSECWQETKNIANNTKKPNLLCDEILHHLKLRKREIVALCHLVSLQGLQRWGRDEL